jgi:hypothetical protein
LKIAGAGSESKWHLVSGARTIANLDLPRRTIGQDNQTLMVVKEVVEPNPLGLMIIKMKLG